VEEFRKIGKTSSGLVASQKRTVLGERELNEMLDLEKTSQTFSRQVGLMALDLHGVSDSNEVVRTVVKYASSLLTCHDVGVLLTYPTVTYASSYGGNGRGLIDKVPTFEARESEAIAIDDTRVGTELPEWSSAVDQLGFRSVASLPLLTNRRLYGVLNLFHRYPNVFKDRRLAFANLFAMHSAIALATSMEESA